MKYELILHGQFDNILLKMKVGETMFYINEGLYKKLYLKLFNAVTDAIALVDEGRPMTAKDVLILAQQDCEELFISQEEK